MTAQSEIAEVDNPGFDRLDHGIERAEHGTCPPDYRDSLTYAVRIGGYQTCAAIRSEMMSYVMMSCVMTMNSASASAYFSGDSGSRFLISDLPCQTLPLGP